MDSSQRNVVFLVHAEKTRHVRTVAGMCYFLVLPSLLVVHWPRHGTTVDYADNFPTLRNQSEIPRLNNRFSSIPLKKKAFFLYLSD